MAYIRSVKTASGATAVQIVWSTRRGSRKIEHLGSAHTPEEVEALKAVAMQSDSPSPRGHRAGRPGTSQADPRLRLQHVTAL